ncbi:MAG: transporter associated domain-containing protein [bacterium]|nr:transporter associated domain-containing protein [bacterium]
MLYELLVLMMLSLLLYEFKLYLSGVDSLDKRIFLLLLLVFSHYLPRMICFSTSKVDSPSDNLDQDSRERLREGLFDFADGSVKEAMVPINDVFKISSKQNIAGLLAHSDFTPYSRIPVFEGEKDNIVGIIYTKHLIGKISDAYENCNVTELSNIELSSFSVVEHIKEAYYVPELMSQLVLLQEFQKRMIQMAIVVDEFGVITGIVTLEDLMETIVGDVQDRRNDDESLLHTSEGKQWVFDAKIDLDDVEEIIGCSLSSEDEEVETLGGYVFQHFGYLPSAGDSLKLQDLEFHVLELENYRLRKVAVKKVAS